MTQKRQELKLDKNGKPIGLPFWYEYSRSDFSSEDDMIENINEQIARYNEILATLRPGEPHPMRWPDQQFDARYQAALNAFEQEQVMERHYARHKPPPQRPPMSPEMRALWEGSPADKAKAQRILEAQRIVEEQTTAAARHRALGNSARARDCEGRAAQWARVVEKERSEDYAWQAAEKRQTVDWGEAQLNTALKWDGKKLEENLEKISAMVEGHREMSTGEHSYVLTGSGESLRLSKVRHPGTQARELAAKLGDIGDENLLLTLSCHGVESREDAPSADSEGEAAGESVGETQPREESFKEYEARMNAADREKHPAPVMFPPRTGQ